MEIWKDIPNYEGRYQASNYGRIRSLPRPRNGNVIRIIKQLNGKDNYLLVSLPCKKTTGRRKSFPVHRLVYLTFHGDVNGIVCHKDGNNRNNRMDNLYLGDVISNTLDKYSHGRTKLTLKEIAEIIEAGVSVNQNILAKKYNVSQGYISRILSGKRAFAFRKQLNEQITLQL